MKTDFHFNTTAIHGSGKPFSGHAQGDFFQPTSVPVVQSSAFEYNRASDIEDVFTGKQFGHVYSRISNPTVTALENRITLLEKGLGTIAVSSGMAAITITLMNILKAGDHIISGWSLFGGTYSLFKNILSKYNIEIDFVDAADLEAIQSRIKKNTKAIYVETIGNPKMDVVDVKGISVLAHENKIPLILDNTIPSPYLLQAGGLGADIIIHSTTKFINGSGNTIGGVLIDTGLFNWDNKKFPGLRDYVKKYRQFAFLAKARKSTCRDMGSCMAPFTAFLTITGLETLGLRMEKHCRNALALAEFLDSHPEVKWVNYSGLKSSEFNKLAKKQFNDKYCSLLSFGLGSRDKGFNLINNLKLVKNMTNLGDVRTLILHPASTIYTEFSEKEKELVGVTDDLLRVSIGIEDCGDIIADFKNSIKEVNK